MSRLTDFLEELLKQQTEEEESQVLLQSTHKPVQLQSGQQENRFPKAELSGISAPTAFAPQFFSVNQRAAEVSLHGSEPFSFDVVPTALGAESVSETPTQSLWDRSRRTYSAARLWQARAVRSVGNSLGTAGQTGRHSYSLGKQDNIVPDFAQLVDAAFARDARRYDGPLRIL